MSKKLTGLDAIAVNLEAEENGAWFEFAGMRFLVARARTKSWINAEKKARIAIYGKESVEDDEREDEKEANVIRHCLSNYAVKIWEDVTYKGEEIPYSVEKAHELFGDEKFRSLPLAIYAFCMNGVNYLESKVVEDEKK